MSAENDREPAPTDGDQEPREERIEPDSAFELLGNETRIAVLDTLNDADANHLSFSALHDAAGDGSSAGFAYHLEKLVGHYVERASDGYRLTTAGRRVARAVVAGTYTERLNIDPIDVDEPCPICETSTLTARCTDNVLAVECGCLNRPVAVLSLPPGGHRRTPGEDLVTVADRYHRQQVALLADGICPECAGGVEATLRRVPAPTPTDHEASDDHDESAVAPAASSEHGSTDERRASMEFGCTECGFRLASPVAVTIVEHPSVIGFFAAHGIDIRERPLWNLGEEWSETTLSTDPWCVRVSVRLDGDRLDVLVGEGPTVHVLDESRTASNSS